MIFYTIYTHLFCAFISLGLFVIRALMQFAGKDWRAIKLLKILPHLSDTLLIVSGAILLFTLNVGFPWWIIAKFGLLIIYIIFAVKFFKRGTTNNPIAFLLALISLLGAILLGYNH
ncbi:SirB2 family protein [Avibacterium sp. 21-599]|uniref:SirB2 family protein n=1 Tax=Avibacterium sp. 21-599 TaxID=2911528 RepID=UPI0022480DCD|nr:SirB2 family protein [Avibacterium sp. 21-599]MCW9718004.1 SirB2 family protein [Avibacterium sp. 21-599]